MFRFFSKFYEILVQIEKDLFSISLVLREILQSIKESKLGVNKFESGQLNMLDVSKKTNTNVTESQEFIPEFDFRLGKTCIDPKTKIIQKSNEEETENEKIGE